MRTNRLLTLAIVVLVLLGTFLFYRVAQENNWLPTRAASTISQEIAAVGAETPTPTPTLTLTPTPTMAPTGTPTGTLVVSPTPAGNGQGAQAFATPSAQPTEVPTNIPTATPDLIGTGVASALTALVPTATSAVITLGTVIPEPDMAVTMTEPITVTMMGDWEIQYFGGATSQMLDWDYSNPVLPWPAFPNIDFPEADFLAKNGVEYGMAESLFCQQDATCDLVVPALHYRLYTGDYQVGELKCMAEDNGTGCAIAWFELGGVTMFQEDVNFFNGFTVTGRIWNGDESPQAIVALLSHAATNMLNLGNELNPGGTNAGSNCSVPDACEAVTLTFVITSGNEILVIGTMVVSR